MFFHQVFSGYLCDRYFRSAVPLVDVFEALGRLGQLDALFSEISEKLKKEVIAPLLSAHHVPPPKVRKEAPRAFGARAGRFFCPHGKKYRFDLFTMFSTFICPCLSHA